jgi:uncharacterized Zn-finger protein
VCASLVCLDITQYLLARSIRPHALPHTHTPLARLLHRTAPPWTQLSYQPTRVLSFDHAWRVLFAPKRLPYVRITSSPCKTREGHPPTHSYHHSVTTSSLTHALPLSSIPPHQRARGAHVLQSMPCATCMCITHVPTFHYLNLPSRSSDVVHGLAQVARSLSPPGHTSALSLITKRVYVWHD